MPRNNDTWDNPEAYGGTLNREPKGRDIPTLEQTMRAAVAQAKADHRRSYGSYPILGPEYETELGGPGGLHTADD